MASYPASIPVTTKYNWRFNESVPTVTDLFTIPAGSSLVRVTLSEYPIKVEPVSTVEVTIIGGGSPLTEVEGVPQNSGEFRVLYEYSTIEFIQHGTQRQLQVQYQGNGSVILATDFNQVTRYINRLLRLRNVNVLPVSGGPFSWDATTDDITVTADIHFIFNIDGADSLAGVNGGTPIREIILEDGTYEILDGTFLYMAVQDDGSVTIVTAADVTALLNATTSNIIVPLFKRVGDALICLWNGTVLGDLQEYDPESPGAGAGALTLQQVLSNGPVSTLDATVNDLIATRDALIGRNIEIDRGLDGKIILNTVSLSGATRTISFPDASGTVALLGSLNLATVLAGGGVANTSDMTVQDVVLRDLDIGRAVTGAVDSGTYTPTFTSVTNVAVTPTLVGSGFYFQIINNVVHVTGTVNIDPTATGNTVLKMTLPVVDDVFANVNQAAGMGVSDIEFGMITSTNAASTVTYTFTAADVAARNHKVSFMYEIIPS